MPWIGVAVAIPEPWATRLQDYRAALGDTTAAMIPTHITLVPPVEVEDVALVAVEAHLHGATSGTAPFEVHLRGTGTFRPVSPVVFVSLVEGISHCEALAASVRTGPLATDLAYPYHPHVTVAHHLDADALDRAFADLAGFECTFQVAGFHLYVHDDVLGWAPRHHFALGADPEEGS